eukprot:CAMPEP_0196598742 /NCGR_PEP_ID=MMETSP1081-20130531/94484_1 /TAXON_ID=36882 /ORGANISM="Pyramimonas amylifera, Strain CCMP720" /LENGTH=150 /DNA_ID=CAMNT_0041924461 /DNA_START=1110 /DNA_END=1558 /DNA_ORIENTATION=-
MEEKGSENIQDLTAEEENVLFNLDNPNNTINDEPAAEQQYESDVLALPPRVVRLSKSHSRIPLVYLNFVMGKLARAVSCLRAARPTGNPNCIQPPFDPPSIVQQLIKSDNILTKCRVKINCDKPTMRALLSHNRGIVTGPQLNRRSIPDS